MKTRNNRYLPTLVVGIFALVVSFVASSMTGDALVFAKMDGNIFSILSSRFSTTTSRVILEFILIMILRYLPILWNIINAGMIMILYYSLRKILNENNHMFINCVIAIFILLYTYLDMSSAGWSATTVNYLWTLSLGVFAMIPIVRILRDEEHYKKMLILTIPSLIVAANQEQSCALLFGFLLIFNIYYFIKNKKIHPVLITYLIITILGFVVILLCPGNFNRVDNEIITWFKDFRSLSFIDKIFLSINNTFEMLLGRANYIVIGFYTILSYFFFKKKNKTLLVISLLFLLGALLIPYLNIFRLNGLYSAKHIADQNVIELLQLGSKSYIVSILISGIYFIGTLILLYNVPFKKSKYMKIFMPVMFIAAILSRFILGFSPTIFASSFRTGIYMNFIIAMLVPIILYYMKLTYKEKKIVLAMLVVILLGKWFAVGLAYKERLLEFLK